MCYGGCDCKRCNPDPEKPTVGNELWSNQEIQGLLNKIFNLEQELKKIDEILARRPALDGYLSREDKIEYAINIAKKVDRLEKELTYIKAQEINQLVRQRDSAEEKIRNLEQGGL